jgi:hypothetical protein
MEFEFLYFVNYPTLLLWNLETSTNPYYLHILHGTNPRNAEKTPADSSTGAR